MVPGAIIAAAGFALWAQQLPDLDLNNQWYWIVMTGAGMGMMLGPASTDAVNRAPRTSYGEVTGITQTARNFGASLGMALLGDDLHRSEQVARRVIARRTRACRRRAPIRSRTRSATRAAAPAPVQRAGRAARA